MLYQVVQLLEVSSSNKTNHGQHEMTFFSTMNVNVFVNTCVLGTLMDFVNVFFLTFQVLLRSKNNPAGLGD